MCCYAGNTADLDDTNWRITQVDTNAKDSLNPEALQSSVEWSYQRSTCDCSSSPRLGYVIASTCDRSRPRDRSPPPAIAPLRLQSLPSTLTRIFVRLRLSMLPSPGPPPPNLRLT